MLLNWAHQKQQFSASCLLGKVPQVQKLSSHCECVKSILYEWSILWKTLEYRVCEASIETSWIHCNNVTYHACAKYHPQLILTYLSSHSTLLACAASFKTILMYCTFLQCVLVWIVQQCDFMYFAPGCIQVPNPLHVNSVTRHSEPRVIKRLTCCLMPKKVVEHPKKGLRGENWWDRSLLFLSYQKLLCRNQSLSQIMVSTYSPNT